MSRRTFLASLALLTIASSAFAKLTSKGTFIMRRVTFRSSGESLVGQLYLPQGGSALNPSTAVIVTGAWFTVKEQMPSIHARELARRGYAAFVFDFRGFGESGGAVRQRETPKEKIEDILAAVDFLKTQPEIEGARIAGLGICASAGYMVAAATQSSDLKAVALVAPWLHDAALVQAIYGGKDSVDGLIAVGRSADESFRANGRQAFVPGASRTDRGAVMFDVPYYTETDRGLIPAWRNEVDPAFWEEWLTFDAIGYAAALKQPFLMVESDAAALPAGARQFYARLSGPKKERWLDGVTQFDFYDQPAAVSVASEAVAEHFAATLG